MAVFSFLLAHILERSRLALDLRSVYELNDAVDEGITILQRSSYPQHDETASYQNDNDALLST